MIYPKRLYKNDIIGICAPSSGVTQDLYKRLDDAISRLISRGYNCIETDSVRFNEKCVSADANQRAKEFMELYENPDVKAIIPPWGGEFLMDMLPCLDFEYIKKLPPKWIIGYSDLTTLIFPVTLICDIATIHGSNLMNLGMTPPHDNDLFVFEVLKNQNEIIQSSSDICGGYTKDFTSYDLTQKTEWKSLFGKDEEIRFTGRMIGGCIDTICRLLGTRFSPVNDFLEKYSGNGFIWAIESCEMPAAEIYRTLWQMRECGWFRFCRGVLFGRPDGYRDTYDFNLKDALTQSFECLNIPVIYDTDIGHKPPQIQIVNGSLGEVYYYKNKGSVRQIFE